MNLRYVPIVLAFVLGFYLKAKGIDASSSSFWEIFIPVVGIVTVACYYILPTYFGMLW